ncbi:hypothetical protein KUV56_13720 [Ferrimonas balearica]|nr:hypothetical protein [Ferrimonas balearica]
MMMKKLLVGGIASFLLSGCGDDQADSIPIDPPASKPPFLTVDVTPNAKFEGEISVYLGRYDDKLKDWLQSDAATDLTGDGFVDERDAHLAGIRNPKEMTIKVDAKEMTRVLASNPDGLGNHSARSDIFVEGHFSVFDLLRYLVHTRPDLRFDQVISPEESGRDTHEFVISWDRNGDGVFDAADDNLYDNSESADWYARIKSNGGDEKKLNGSLDGKGPQGEGHYERLDQLWLQPGMAVRFQPFSPEMTERRKWVQDREMARLEQFGGKVVVPQLMINKGTGAPIVITNLEVKPHNMRPDIFQPGVITKMDVFLSARDLGWDVKFNYWPILSTGAKVEHFALFSFDGLDSTVGRGWSTVYGEMATNGDFAAYQGHGDVVVNPGTTCEFSKPEKGGMDLVVDPEHCRLDWQSKFGGNVLHLMSDTWVMNQPVEMVMAGYMSHYGLWGMEEFNGMFPAERDFSEANDGSDIVSLQTFALPEADDGAPVLTEQHFGWKIADCTECHNEQKQPLGHGGHSWPINSSDGFAQTQPYYCATCHGNNGAPQGHNETARCFWCHAGETHMPKHHGEASTKRLYQQDELVSNDKIYNNYPADVNALPRDKFGNYEPYEAIWSSKNSDWDMSMVFPDPYSCMTCHPNSQ